MDTPEEKIPDLTITATFDGESDEDVTEAICRLIGTFKGAKIRIPVQGMDEKRYARLYKEFWNRGIKMNWIYVDQVIFEEKP